MNEADFMLDIEYKLYSDRTGLVRRGLQTQLSQIQQRLRQSLRQPQGLEKNRELKAGLQAVEAAMSLLRRYGA